MSESITLINLTWPGVCIGRSCRSYTIAPNLRTYTATQVQRQPIYVAPFRSIGGADLPLLNLLFELRTASAVSFRIDNFSTPGLEIPCSLITLLIPKRLNFPWFLSQLKHTSSFVAICKTKSTTRFNERDPTHHISKTPKGNKESKKTKYENPLDLQHFRCQIKWNLPQSNSWSSCIYPRMVCQIGLEWSVEAWNGL